MEVFPLEDVGAAGDVGGPAVSQVEQMQSWDDSFTQLEKALQAAYETKEAKTDISSFTRQIPASLTVSTSRPESSTDRLENKRKWGDIYSPETDESSRLKFKRTAKLLPGGVTITLLESPKENSDVSDTVRSLVSDVKDSEKTADIQTCQPNSQNSNHNEDVFCNIQEVENPLDHISSSDSNLFENENHGEPNESKNTSHIPTCDGIKENPILFESKNYSPGADQDSNFHINKTDDSLTHKLQKDSVTTATTCDHVKNVDNDVATEVSDSSIWDSILQENKEHSDIKNQTEDFPKPLEKVVNFQTTSDDDTEKIGASTQLESNLEQEEQAEKCSTKEEQSEKSNKKDDSSEKNSKKDEKLKKKKFERCNIRDIKLEDELDAVTLSAQKEEQERIKRLQEAQMRALQERLQIIEVEKEALTQLFSQPATDDDPALFNSTSHNSEASEEIDDKSKIPLIKSETDVILLESSDDDKKRKLEEIIPAPSESEENIIDISSSSSEGASDSEDDLEKKDDDIMVLSDDGGDAEAGPEDPNNSGAHTNDCFNLPDHEGRVLVNVGHPPEDPDIFLAPQIAKVIKPHQIGGIRFLYDNVVENLERYKSSTGFGCILAHSMGLGKTVQVVSFVDVFLRHTPATLVLCIVPINTIQNWKAEFDMWVPPVTCVENEHVASGDVRPRDYNIYTLNENFKTMAARASLIAEWRKEGGVLLMGYEMYRMLALRKMPKIPLKKGRRLKKQEVPIEPETCEQIKKFMDQMYEHIVIPGPDLVICDEGHRIKNSLASTSMALKSIKTRRRVVLTGYPLQNNLLEYWCMVDFVRPNYLGSRAEFCNMFERPISNGQCIDSTPRDRQLMRFRSHVLHSLLVGFVQRRGHSVLRAVLPKKEEHVLLIRMTPIQRKLYKCFVKDLLYVQQATNPLKLFAVCCKIWNHPDILYKLLQEKRAQEDIDLDIDLNPSSAVSSNALIKKKTKEQMKSKMLQRPLKCSTIKMSTSDLKIPKTELLSNSGQTCKMLGQPVTIKTEGQISENVHLNQQNSQLLEMSQDSKSPLCKEEYPLSLHSSGTQPSQNSHVTIKQESTHKFSHVQYSQNNSAFCQQGFSQSSSLQPCQPQLQNTPQYGHQSQNQQYSSASQQPFQQQFMNSSLPQAQYMHQSQNAFSQLRNNYGQQSNGPPQGGNQPYSQPADNSPQIGNTQQFPQNTDIPSPSLNNQYSQVLNESGTGTNNKNCAQPPNGSVNNNNQFPQPSGRSKIATKLYPIPSSRPTQMGNNHFSQSGNCSSQGGNHFSPTSNISTHGGSNQQFPLQPAGTSELANNHFAQSVSVSPQLPNNPQYPQTSCGSSDTGNFASSSHVSTAVGSSQLYTQSNSGSSQEVSNPQFSQSPSGSSQMTNKQFPLQQSSVPQVGGNQPYSQSSDNSSQVGNNQAYPSTAAASSQVGANQQFSQHSSSSQVGNNPQFPQPCTEQSQIANNQPQIGNNQQFPQQLNEPSQIGSNHQFPQTCNEQPQIGNNPQYSQQSNEQSQISSTQQCTQLPDGSSQTGNGQLYHQQLNESSQVLTERPFSSQHPFPMQTNSQGESNFAAQSTNQDNLHQKLSQFSSPNNSQYTQQQFPSPGNQSQISFNQESVNTTCPIKPLPHISINSQSNFNQKTKSQYIKHTPQQQYSPQSVAQTQQYAPNQLRQHGQQSQQIQKYNEQISSQHKPFSDKHEVQPQYTEQAGGEVQQCHDNTKNHQKYPDHSVVQQAFIQHSPSQSQYSQRPQTQPSRTQQTYSQTSATLDVLPPFSHPSPNQKLSQQSPPQHFTQQPSPQYNQQSSPMQTYSQCSPLQQQFPQQSPPLQPSPSQSQYSLPSPTQQTYPQFPQQSSNASQYLPQSSHQYPQESSPQQQYSQTQYNSQSSSQQYPQHSSPQQQFQQQSPKQTYGQFLQHGQQYPRQPSPHQNYLQQPRQPPFHMTHQQQYNQNVQPYKSNLNTSNFTPQSPGQGPHYNSSQVGNSHQYGSQQQQQLPSRQSFPGPHSLSDPYSLQIPQSNSPQVFNQQPLRNSSPQYCQSSQPTTGTFAQPSSPPSPSYSQQSQQCHQNKQYQQPFMQQNAQSFQQYQPQLPQSMQPPQKMHSSMQLKNTKQPLSKNGKSLSHVNLNCQTVQPQLLDHSADAVQNPQYPNFQNNLQQNQAQHFSQTTKTGPNASNQNYQQIHESSVKNEHFAAENIKEEANVSFASKSSKAVMVPAKTQTTTPQTNVLPYQQVQAQENCKIENDTPGVSETSIAPCRERIDSSISYEWAIPLMKDYVLGVLENSHKIMVLFAIIDQTLEKGDKLLVFSQSLSTLDLLEHFLGKVKVPKCYSDENNLENWCRNKNYFRLDGSTSAQEREKLINEFNRNENVSLFLLSTRAGCLGINLVGANRIVVMDASWNPCHDAQAVCRIYRYGQKKQCHIYRLVTDNSLEKRIYDRQVNKQGMSDRVVDELNPESNFTWKDVTTLIQDDEDDGPIQELIKFESSYSDDVLKYLVSKMGPSLSKEPFEHESLLLDRKDLKLTKQEKRMAKQSYEQAKRQNMINIRTTYTYMPGGGQFIINNKQGQWVGGTTVRVLPGQPRGGGRPGTTATPITASPSLMNSLFKQGVMVQKLTIPSNISIPVLTPGAPPVVIPAGQDVLVLRTPKGVYLRLPDGRIIAVQLPPSLLAKTQFRPNVVTHFRPTVPKGNQSVSNNSRGQSIGIIKQTLQCGGTVRLLGPKNASNAPQSANRSSAPEIIDLSDDEEPSFKRGNLSNASDETDSSASEQDQNCNKQSTSVLPGKQITIRRVSPALQQNSVQLSNAKDKCDLPMKLQQNQQITIMPINTNVQQNRQKLAPQLAQPVRVQQMLLQPQQGKRKSLPKSTTKIHMASYPVNKSFQKQQITVTPTQNIVQIQKLKQSPVHQPPLKALNNGDQTITISSNLKNSNTSVSVSESSEKSESHSDSNIPVEHTKCSIDNKDLSMSPVTSTNQEKLPSNSSSVTVTPLSVTVPLSSSHLKSMSSSSQIIEKRPALLPQSCENVKSLQQPVPVSSVENLHIHSSNFTQLSSPSMTISQLPQTTSNLVHSNTTLPITSQASQINSKLHQQTFVDSKCLETKAHNIGSSPPQQNSFQLPKVSDLCSSSEKQICRSPSKLSQVSPPHHIIDKVSQLPTQFTETTTPQNTSAVPNLQALKSQVDTKVDAIETSTLNSPKNLQSEMMTMQRNPCAPHAQLSPHCFEDTQNGQINSETYMQQQPQQQLPHFHHHSGLRPPLISSQTQQQTPTKRKKSTNRSTAKKSQQIHTPLNVQGSRQNPISETHQFPYTPLSEHLHDHHFQPFSHPLQNSDFPPFQSYATHKNLLHIQHPQPLHPLQHNQEHSLVSHLSHMPHIYPMSSHMTGNPCISDIQPQGPCAWPVPQSSMSSFHPFGQSSQYYSSSHDSSQYPFQPSSFSLSQPTSSHVPQAESNAGVLDHVSSACPSEL